MAHRGCSRKTNAVRPVAALATWTHARGPEFVPLSFPPRAEGQEEKRTPEANARFVRSGMQQKASGLVSENPEPAWVYARQPVLGGSLGCRSEAVPTDACALPTAAMSADCPEAGSSTCASTKVSPTEATASLDHLTAAPSTDATTQATRTNVPMRHHLPQFPPFPHSAAQQPAYSSTNAVTNLEQDCAAEMHPAEFSPLSHR